MHFLLFLLQVGMLTIIWLLIKSLNNFLDKRIPFDRGAITRVVLQIALTLLIVAPIFIGIFILMHKQLPAFVNREFIGIAVALFVVVIFLFNFVFYAFYFFSNWQGSIEDKAKLEVQAAELEKEKFNLQYHQLRNQVNPHYLFNTLTSLDGLIHTNPELASEFVRHMAKVYRYVLQHKESEVVNVDEELEFIQHYIRLQHIRYGDGLKITHTISDAAKDKGIVMVTLQMLIDNAIKHNIVQVNEPLHIHITDELGYLVVHNNKQLRRQIETSNGKGILQLQQLYTYLTEEQVIIENTDKDYSIKIPLL
jgi:sensor histidine kinase YesM